MFSWTAQYGSLAVMTFVVNQQGKVYEKDLGKDTAKLAEEIKTYNPGKTWKLIEGARGSGK